jgi:hypothetical protein
MKRFRRWAIAALAGLVALFLASVLWRDAVLQAAAERVLEEETGLRAVMGELTTSLGSGALRVRGLKLYNPPEFGGRLMADVPELLVNLDTSQAADGRLHFRELRLDLAQLHLVRNAAGRLNLEGVEQRVRERLHKRRKKRGDKFEFQFAGIERLQLSVGQVHYDDLRHPRRALAVNVAVTNELATGLKTEEDLEKWASALVFRILLQVSLRQLGRAPGGGDEPVEDALAP